MIGFGFRNGLIRRIHKYVSIKKTIRDQLLVDLENDQLLMFHNQVDVNSLAASKPENIGTSQSSNLFYSKTEPTIGSKNMVEGGRDTLLHGRKNSGVLNSMSNNISPDTHSSSSKPLNQIKSHIRAPNQISFVGVPSKKSKSSSLLYDSTISTSTRSNSTSNLVLSNSLKGTITILIS